MQLKPESENIESKSSSDNFSVGDNVIATGYKMGMAEFGGFGEIVHLPEEWVVKYQNIILALIGIVAVGVLAYLGYQNYVIEPKTKEAISELNQAQLYFELAVNTENSDSLYKRALNGGEGKYGFLDIIENYKGNYQNKFFIIY